MSAEKDPGSVDDQVRKLLRLMGNDAVHLDDLQTVTGREVPIPDSLVEPRSTDILARIAYPIYKHMLHEGGKVWSIKGIVEEGYEHSLDNGESALRYTLAILHLVNKLNENHLLDIRGGDSVIGNETMFSLDYNCVSAFEFLTDLAQSAGENPNVIEGYRSDAQYFRYLR